MSTCLLLLSLFLGANIARALSNGSSSASRHASPSSSVANQYFTQHRRDILNLLNHPLQLQLLTGDLPLGSFRRLVADRTLILEGLQSATSNTLPGLFNEEIARHVEYSEQWLNKAESHGKTIHAPGIQCYTCGGEHLNIDCPNDDDAACASSGASALRSVLESHGVAGASAVLRSYGFCCARLLDAVDEWKKNTIMDDEETGGGGGGDVVAVEDLNLEVYTGWIEVHADTWSKLADVCEATLGSSEHNNSDISSSYSICLSMFYNWLDSEAATTGIRLETKKKNGKQGLSSSIVTMKQIVDTLEVLEPGYAAQRDRHSSFVADVTGAIEDGANARVDAAKQKVNAAAAYLAAKKKNKDQK